MTLKRQTVSGVKWQVVLQVSQKFISIATFAVLARILEPSVFGLFALSFVLINGLSLFKSFGIDAGIIQRSDCSEPVQSTAFYIVQATGLIVFLLCIGLAPLASAFFRNAEVGSVIQALGVIFIMDGFGKVPASLLARDMRFRLLSVTQMIGTVINSVFAIAFALISPSVWSLVFAYLIKTAVVDTLHWRFSGFRLRLIFDRKIARELLGFGSFLMGSSLFRFIGENFNNVVVGRLLDTTRVGYLALATNAAAFINTHFTYLILRVLFPAYSKLQNDRAELKRAFLKVLKFISVFTMPFCVALAMLAEDLVLTLYGDQWLAIVPLVQVTAFIQLIASILSGIGPIYIACGRPKYAMHLSALNLFIRIPLVIIFTKLWGVQGTVTAELTTMLIMAPLNLTLVRQTIPFSLGEFFRSLVPALTCTAFMALIIFCVKHVIPEFPTFLYVIKPALLTLLTATAAGGLAYVILFYLLDRTTVIEIKGLLIKS